MRLLLLCVTLACLPALAACSEEPQHLEAAKMPGFRTDDWDAQLRTRTRHQGESDRIYR